MENDAACLRFVFRVQRLSFKVTLTIIVNFYSIRQNFMENGRARVELPSWSDADASAVATVQQDGGSSTAAVPTTAVYHRGG